MRRFVQRYRTPNNSPPPLPLPPLAPVWTRRQVAWLLVLDPPDLSPEDAAYLEALCQASPDMLTAYQLAQRFVIMVKQQQVDAFDPWLADAQSCSVTRLRTFADGLLKDYAAVRAALEFEESNELVAYCTSFAL